MTKKKNKKLDPLPIPKIIVRTGQFLNLISTKAVVLFAAKLFTTPIKHRIPKRELEMDTNSIQQLIKVLLLINRLWYTNMETVTKK